jgi:ABC-type long-subunit fatty acid transport system fused permease/ATPase subunit
MCLQEQYILPCCTFLQSNGMIIHPELVENWDALKSTIHVIKIIANIRSSYDVKNMTAPLDNMVNDTVMTNDNIDIKHKFTDITSITENDNTTDDDEMSV